MASAKATWRAVFPVRRVDSDDGKSEAGDMVSVSDKRVDLPWQPDPAMVPQFRVSLIIVPDMPPGFGLDYWKSLLIPVEPDEGPRPPAQDDDELDRRQTKNRDPSVDLDLLRARHPTEAAAFDDPSTRGCVLRWNDFQSLVFSKKANEVHEVALKTADRRGRVYLG